MSASLAEASLIRGGFAGSKHIDVHFGTPGDQYPFAGFLDTLVSHQDGRFSSFVVGENDHKFAGIDTHVSWSRNKSSSFTRKLTSYQPGHQPCASVPEPATLTVLAAGLLCLAAIRRRTSPSAS